MSINTESGNLVLTAIGAVVFVLAVVAGLSLLGAYPTKWIVNYLFAPGLLTATFGTAKIGFWQAFWFNYITATLFKTVSTNSK